MLFGLCLFIGTVFSYLSPYLNGLFVDFLILNQSQEEAICFALLVATIGIISALLSYSAGTLSVNVASRVSFSILRDIVAKYERREYKEIRKLRISFS